MAPRPVPRTKLSRRRFLTGTAGILMTLAACGGDDGPDNQPAGGEAAATPGYDRGDMLLAPGDLASDISSDGPRLIAFMPDDTYQQGRIDGAVATDWPAFEVTDTTDASLERWRADVQRIFGELGLATDDRVVIYDDGTLFAARMWWLLHYLGHQDQQVLNGGLAAWEEAGNDLANGTATPEPATYQGSAYPDVLAQISEVQEAFEDENTIFVDARSPDEYAAGHLPGAVNIQYTRNAVDGSPRIWKPQDELTRMYEEAGVTPDRTVIPYCSTGVRSAVTYFTLRLIGYENVALFTGSWAEWSSHPELPVET